MLIPKLQKRPKRRREITVYGRPETMGTLRHFVLSRERECFALKVDRFGHECKGPLTLEHVTGVHGPEDPRRDNERHCVATCLGINGISIASHELREQMRDHLRALYPECSPD